MALLKSVDRYGQGIVLTFSEPIEVISTVPTLSNVVKHVVIHRVEHDFDPENLIEYYRATLRSLGLEEAVVLLTAVDLEKHSVVLELREPYETVLFLSIGFEPPTCIYTDRVFDSMKVSTINIVVVVNAPLSFNAMVDLLRTVAEAKSMAVADLGLRCSSRCPGTVSDAIVVGKPRRLGNSILFAGMSTKLGNAVARAIHRALVKHGFETMDLDDVLKNIVGYGAKELIDIALEIYRRAPIPGLDEEEVRRFLEEELRIALRDPNVWSFLIAARELDLRGVAGTIPNLSREEFARDSPRIVSDEILGLALALYLANAKAIFTMYWIERMKNELGIDLPMFEDDVVTGLLATMLTRFYDRYASR